MENDPFTDYIERELSFEKSHGFGGSSALKEKEELAWSLHENGSAAGGMLLGDSLLRTRVSFARREVKVVPFARNLVEESFRALDTNSDKDQWDWYYLGIAHEFGRGTKVDHQEAAECFRRAKELGNPFAEFEEIWSRFLSDGELIEAVLRLRACEGRLKDFADASARSLSLIALGPTREIGSYQHAWRIHEISQLLHLFLYHDAGSRHINIAVEAELRSDIDALEEADSASAAFVLFLIAKRSRRNPTSNEPIHWLRLAATPDSGEFVSLLRRQNLTEEELKALSEVCTMNDWKDSEIAKYAASEFELLEADDDDYDS
jgi:hypothetical protein